MPIKNLILTGGEEASLSKTGIFVHESLNHYDFQVGNTFRVDASGSRKDVAVVSVQSKKDGTGFYVIFEKISNHIRSDEREFLDDIEEDLAYIGTVIEMSGQKYASGIIQIPKVMDCIRKKIMGRKYR